MPTYFPYSHIIVNICNNICQTIARHTYFMDWTVCEQKQNQPGPITTAISEIYY